MAKLEDLKKRVDALAEVVEAQSAELAALKAGTKSSMASTKADTPKVTGNKLKAADNKAFNCPVIFYGGKNIKTAEVEDDAQLVAKLYKEHPNLFA